MKNEGITLVALVIMIILLIILASVTIFSFTGNSNVFEKAERARDEYGTASEDESQKIKGYENSIEDILNGITFPNK